MPGRPIQRLRQSFGCDPESVGIFGSERSPSRIFETPESETTSSIAQADSRQTLTYMAFPEWARQDLNLQPTDYESAALTGLSYGPEIFRWYWCDVVDSGRAER